MTTFSFTFVVDGIDPYDDAMEDRFFEAGCDDATIALMHNAIALCFSREAPNYIAAVVSAYQNILDAGASVVRFEPDFLVSASEIAKRAGLSRAAVSLYEKGERASNFPKPVARIMTSSPLWDWVCVARWLVEHNKISADHYINAQVSRIANSSFKKGVSPAELEKAFERQIEKLA
jgi:predicted transcriptional regulator